jgi:hypothetical protein
MQPSKKSLGKAEIAFGLQSRRCPFDHRVKPVSEAALQKAGGI